MREGTGLLPLYSRPLAVQFLVMMLVILFVALTVMGVGMLLSAVFFGEGFSVNDVLSGEPGGAGRHYLLFSQVISQLSLFLIPGLIISWMMKGDVVSWLGLKTPVYPGTIILILLMAGSLIPVTSAAGYVNSMMELPGWLAGVEEWIREREEQASSITGHLVYAGGIPVSEL